MATQPLRESRRRIARRCAFLLLFAALVVKPSRPIRAQTEGVLDPSFYFDGKYTLPPGSGNQTIWAMVAAPDGRLVVAGYRNAPGGESTLFWAALDGETAPTICSPVTVAGGTSAGAHAAAFDDQGRLLLAGSAAFGLAGQEGIALRYLYPACDLDETWNGDGIFVSSQTLSASFEGIAVDSQQRVVLGGNTPGGDTVLAARLTTSGLYDFGFAGDGHLELDLGAGVEIAAMRLQADDRILLGGSIANPAENRNFLAVRLDPLGDLDSTFSGDGVAEVDFGLEHDSAYDLAVDPVGGGLILVGKSGYPLPVAAVARLNSAGVLDSTFGGGDGRWTDSVADITALSAVMVQSDGKLLLAGDFKDVDEDYDFLAYRLTPGGTLDGSFGFFGAASVAFNLGGNLHDSVEAAALHDGKLLLAGSADDDPSSPGAVARLWIALLFADGFESGASGQWSAVEP
jgi:uncharacterized delta-60 repeat protein